MRIRFGATRSGKACSSKYAQSSNLKWINRSGITVQACIYCGSQSELSDEHPVPFSACESIRLVGGRCKECRLTIKPHENYVFCYRWAKPRESYQAPARKAKKDGRWTGISEIMDDEGHKFGV